MARIDTIVDSTIRITDPTDEVKQWCRKNLVLPNPEYAKKARMGFWTGNTPQTLTLYEVHGDTWVLPFGLLRPLAEFIDWSHAESGFEAVRDVDYGEPVPLYDYQQEAVERARMARYGILQSPAGSGKTQMGIALVKQFGRTALWLTHTKDLLKQSRERAERYMDKSLIGTITEGRVNISKGITFATVQTMCKLDLAQYKHKWDVIIVDECHHVSGSPTTMTQFYKVLNSLSARHKYGLSATVHRADGLIRAAYAMLGEIVYTVPEEAVANKIMKVGIIPVGTPTKITPDCLNPDGTLSYVKLINALCDHPGRNDIIVEAIVGNRDYSCLILSDRLAHLEELMNLLPDDMRQLAVMISGKMTTKKEKAARDEAIEQMRSGEKRYLFASYNLAKEGLDIPCLERLFLTTPQKDFAVITQSIGRVARTHDGKADPIAYDFVDMNIGFLMKAYKARVRTYRKSYLTTKINIGRMVGLDDIKALSMTNAKLTAAFLQARRPNQPWMDERQYQYPANLKREYIPQEVFDFFDRMYDMGLTHDEVYKSKLKLNIDDCPVTIAYGGIHGAIPNYIWREDTGEGRIIRNYDVGSYYPHLMTINGYTSRNIPDPVIYEDMLERRMQAKKSGDKVTANALKLIANTTYGAQLNQYNDLYDPLMARSVCISGQLYLLELSEHLHQDVPGLRIVQLNTDGIMVEFHKDYYDEVLWITQEWQDRTGFELEEDSVARIYQKDVNGYVEVATDGSVKKKGGYVVRGIAPAGAFNVNNNATIVARAITEYFVNGTPVEQTVNEASDVFEFQMIAKAGAKYREAYHLVDGEKQPVQKVNRVYATRDERYGKLYKVKADDDSEAKIDSLPEHCIIDNTAVTDHNHTTLDRIDKQFYIDMATKRINDFLGIKPEKPKRERKKRNMPAAKSTEKPLNVYQRLLLARQKFLAAGVAKSGTHNQLEYHYFTLDDIVPVAEAIFAEVGLLGIVNITVDTGLMNVINVDAPEEVIAFSCPFKPGMVNSAVSEVQAIGSGITYTRRYLYQIAMDTCELDLEDSGTVSGYVPPVAPAAPARPASPETRQQIKEELTNVEGSASERQIRALKDVLKDLKASDPSKEEMIAKIAVETKGFTVISKSDCEKLILRISAMLEGGNT